MESEPFTACAVETQHFHYAKQKAQFIDRDISFESYQHVHAIIRDPEHMQGQSLHYSGRSPILHLDARPA